ncbi:hypothetical protein [Citrobacter sp. NCU1]|uniref:hypothetical protein n=1 Tax=Citrobacter sp. NCU1 TaxID=2026683 RepID=UPI00406D0357
MNGDNDAPTWPLVASLHKGLFFYLKNGQKKPPDEPAVNACMDRFVFCFIRYLAIPCDDNGSHTPYH